MQLAFVIIKEKALAVVRQGPGVFLTTTKDDAKPYRPMPINPRELSRGGVPCMTT